MSRVGKLPIQIPQGIKIDKKGDLITVTGEKGELKQRIHLNMKVSISDGTLSVERPNDEPLNRSLHGLTRTLIQNMVTGLSDGFEKKLEIVGVGYRAEIKGKALVLFLGYSHPIYFVVPEGITTTVQTPTTIAVSGIDKQLVGQVAAKIRSFRPPEPYKGKGIRYADEHVRRKAGKTNA